MDSRNEPTKKFTRKISVINDILDNEFYIALNACENCLIAMQTLPQDEHKIDAWVVNNMGCCNYGKDTTEAKANIT